jgi:CheY-like chemotaxis protein
MSQQRTDGSIPFERPVVLIVDDAPYERALLFRTLESDGFMVVDAANGREASRILESDPTVRVLIADILMLGISGTMSGCCARLPLLADLVG